MMSKRSTKGPQNWVAAALGITLLCGGIAVVPKVATGIESGKAFAVLSMVKAGLQFSDSSQDPKLSQNTKIETSEFARLNYLFDDANLSNFGPRRYRLLDIQVAIAREVGEGVIVTGGRRQGLWSTSSLSDMDYSFNSVRPSPTSQASIAIPAVAEGRLTSDSRRSPA
jgi:hypothetical protein